MKVNLTNGIPSKIQMQPRLQVKQSMKDIKAPKLREEEHTYHIRMPHMMDNLELAKSPMHGKPRPKEDELSNSKRLNKSGNINVPS